MNILELDNRISQLDERLSRIEANTAAARSVYLGDGKILIRSRACDVLYIVDGSDRLIVPKLIADGIYEGDLTNFFIRNIKPTDNCIDVGANFGYYSILLGRLAHGGRHIAIEANPRTFALLKDNIFANWIEGIVTPIQAAIADRSGTITLNTLERRSGNTGIIPKTASELEYLSDESRSFEARCFTLDDLPTRLERVDYLKIDVEGAEPLVMRGARHMIETQQDLTIVMEWSPGQLPHAGFDPAAFAQELKATDLKPLRLLHDGGVAPISWDEVAVSGYCNLVMTKRPADSFR
jgi:FkbM family methyltransferase